jgi:hypothetical protein
MNIFTIRAVAHNIQSNNWEQGNSGNIIWSQEFAGGTQWELSRNSHSSFATTANPSNCHKLVIRQGHIGCIQQPWLALTGQCGYRRNHSKYQFARDTPIPFVNSVSELLAASLDAPSSPVRRLARKVFDVMSDAFDERQAKPSAQAKAS